MRFLRVLVLGAGFLAAMPAALAGEPLDPHDAVLRMTTQKLATAMIEDAVLAGLAGRQVDIRGATLEFTGLSATASLAADATLAIDRLSFQPATQRFVAVVVATAPGGAPQRMSAIGRLVRETQLPVPNRPLPAGRPIAAGDREWVAAGDRPLAGNVARDPAEMIGRLPRRSLQQGAPVNTADLKRPVVVARGTLVTILLGTPTMRLTARGQALDEGAVGDTIRVANAQSRTVVGGVVRADGQVEVIAGSQPAAAR
ncbi:MAG: flagellar basal body P-ring formation chaperone FlgA [Rhodospirillales bacterium]